MASTTWYSICPYGAGDIKTGTPAITISNGVATLSEAQTGNIGCGCCIETASNRYYIAPNRLGFDSGATEIKIGDKVQGATSGAEGIVRAVEVTAGSWSGGDAAGYIYFESTSGTWQDNEQINRTKPASVTNVATVNGTLQGNIGNGNTQFVVKTATGGTPGNISSTAVSSIHHEYASVSDFEAGVDDANHVNNSNFTSTGADVQVFGACYYDHDDYTLDTTNHRHYGSGMTTDASHFIYLFTPTGGAESINNQRHDGKWNTQRFALSQNVYSYTFSIETNTTYFDGLQLEFAYTGGGEPFYYYSNTVNAYISNCIVKTIGSGIIFNNSGLTNAKVSNSVVYNYSTVTGDGIKANAHSTSITLGIYNCTVYNFDDGIERDAGIVIVRNCAVFGNNDDFDAVTDVDHCASDDGDGTNAVTPSDWSAVFEDYTNGDFHLKSTDTDLKDAGIDLTSEGLWCDIDGETRSTPWDIGADEYVSGGGGQTALFETSLNLAASQQAVGHYSALLTSSVGLTGAQTSLAHLLAALSGNTSLSEQLQALAHLQGQLSSTAHLEGQPSGLRHRQGQLTSTTNFQDQFAGLAHLQATLSTSLDVSSPIRMMTSLKGQLSSSLTITGSFEVVGAATALFTSIITLNESLETKASLLAAISDTLTLGATPSALASLKAALTSTFGLSSEFSTQLIMALSATLELGASTEALGHFLASLSDNLIATDSTEVTVHYKLNLSDNLSLGEQITAAASYIMMLTDALGLSALVRDVTVTASGVVTITFNAENPGVSFSAGCPGATFSGKGPNESFS